MIEREPISRSRAAIMSSDGETLMPERPHERNQRGRDTALGPARGHGARSAGAVARQIGDDKLVAERKGWSDLAPGYMRLGKSVE
jgi:hypothetical protein